MLNSSCTPQDAKGNVVGTPVLETVVHILSVADAVLLLISPALACLWSNRKVVLLYLCEGKEAGADHPPPHASGDGWRCARQVPAHGSL